MFEIHFEVKSLMNINLALDTLNNLYDHNNNNIVNTYYINTIGNLIVMTAVFTWQFKNTSQGCDKLKMNV